MPKKIYMYSSTKKELLDWYKYLFKKKDLHSHFFFNRDYQNETKKELLEEIEKYYTLDFLREDLDIVGYEKKKKIFKDYEDIEKDLKTLQKKSDIIKLIRSYIHPLDCKYLWKKSKSELIIFLKNY